MHLRRFLIAALMVALPLGVVWGLAKGEVGDPCEHDGDCKSGWCLDLSEVDDGCHGKVCSQPCERTSDCPDVAQEPDCDSIGKGDERRDVCLYGEWETTYCK